jgi:hypothetical protein
MFGPSGTENFNGPLPYPPRAPLDRGIHGGKTDDSGSIGKSTVHKDGNGHKISACPRIENPMGTDTGLSLCPRARA